MCSAAQLIDFVQMRRQRYSGRKTRLLKVPSLVIKEVVRGLEDERVELYVLWPTCERPGVLGRKQVETAYVAQRSQGANAHLAFVRVHGVRVFYPPLLYERAPGAGFR